MQAAAGNMESWGLWGALALLLGGPRRRSELRRDRRACRACDARGFPMPTDVRLSVLPVPVRLLALWREQALRRRVPSGSLRGCVCSGGRQRVTQLSREKG